MPSPLSVIRVFNLLSNGQMLITWNAAIENNIASYKVYRSSSPTDNSEYSLVATVTAPSTSYVDFVPYSFGIVYYYKVTSVDTSAVESDISLTNPSHENSYHSFEEQPFPTSVTTNNFIVDENPTGLVNGSNTLYTTSYPYRKNTVEVYVEGLRLVRGVGFTEGPGAQQVTLTVAPTSGNKVRFNYLRY